MQEQQEQPQQPSVASETKHPYVANGMNITEDEREWAKEIKSAIAKCPELDPVSDFVCAQLAIVSLAADPVEAHLEGILERLGHFQEYRKQHNFPDRSYCAFSRKLLNRVFCDLIPGHYLSFTYFAEDKSYVLASDMSAFSRQVLEHRDNLDAYLAVNWLLMEAQQPEFDAMRSGATLMVDCEGYDWKNQDMVNIDVMRQLTEVDSLYPVHVRKMKFFHTGMFANLCFAMTKKLMPKHLIQHVEVGCQWEGHLSAFFLLPNLQRANENNLSRIDDALRRRAINEAFFTLD